ncbi:hypothetical protein V3C99_000399 [Haemonchus contortus]
MATIMLLFWNIVVLLQTCCHQLAFCEEHKKTVPEIIRHWGYPVEIHHTITEDGYILELHRIPYGKNKSESTTERPVVFLQHGLECSSADWVMNLPGQSAGFVFADAGFDVWMGNMRGNMYSKKHTHLDPDEDRFWNFTWARMAEYDLPAMIDRVLNISGQPYVYYVGHSQGSLTMLVKLSTDPSFCQKIKIMFALAPAVFVTHTKGLMKVLATENSPEFDVWIGKFGSGQFSLSDSLMSYFKPSYCEKEFQRKLCKKLLFKIGGPSKKVIDTTRISVYLSHFPAGTSSLNVLHWVQMGKTGCLSQLDYGEKMNMEIYGQESPPSYDFRKIPHVPIHIFSGGNDWIADDYDIKTYLVPLIEPLIKSNTHLPEYNHFDFTWGTHVADDVHRPIMGIIRESFRLQSEGNCSHVQ